MRLKTYGRAKLVETAYIITSIKTKFSEMSSTNNDIIVTKQKTNPKPWFKWDVRFTSDPSSERVTR